MGLRLAQSAYNNRRAIIRARRYVRTGTTYVRSIARAKIIAAKRQKFSTKNVGHEPGVSTGKTYESVNVPSADKSTRTLYSTALCNIPKGDERNQREKTVVNIRGFKLCLEVKNLTQEPMYVNIAVISPKAAADAAAIPGPEFFRAEDNADRRGTNFVNGLSSSEFHCLPINTDLYTILKHQRLMLIPGSETDPTTNSAEGKSYEAINMWIPLRRQLRYDAPNSAPTDGQVFLVYWFTKFGEPGGVTPTTNAVKFTERVVTYFRDPSQCGTC